MIPGKKYGPEDLLQIARRRLWMIAVPFILVAAGTIGVSLRLPDYYRSRALILVVPQQVPESYVRSAVTTRIEERLQAITQQILSRTRLEQIIQDFNLYVEERKKQLMEDVIEEMRKSIDIQIVKGDAFQLSYISSDPRTAMHVTERLAAFFIDENLRDREVLAEGTSQFLQSQMEDARRRLEEHDKKLEQFRLQYSGELPSQLEANLHAMQNLQLQVQALVESINRDRDRRLVLQRLIADATSPESAPPPAPAGSSDPDPLALGGGPAVRQLEAAQTALRALQLRLTPEHPDVVRLKRVMRELEKKAEAEALERPLSEGAAATPPPNPAEAARRNRIREIEAAVEETDRQVAHKEAEERRLREAIAAYQQRVDAVPTRESELIALTRDYDTLQQNYRSLLIKKEDSQLAANLEHRQIGEQFKILDPARLPEKPSSPNRAQIDLLGALIGLAAGIGLTVILEMRDGSVRSDTDLTAVVALPVIAVIPLITSTAERRSLKRRTLILSASAATAIVATAALAWKFGVIAGALR